MFGNLPSNVALVLSSTQGRDAHAIQKMNDFAIMTPLIIKAVTLTQVVVVPGAADLKPV